MSAVSPPLLTLAAVVGAMVVLWVASIAKRDVSIVDIFWGLGFVLAGWIYFATAPSATPRGWLVALLVMAWGVRLSVHLFRRKSGEGEDYRYREMRERRPRTFVVWSLFAIFLLQGGILWLVSFPLYQAIHAQAPASITPLDLLGALVVVFGIGFESIGDAQLARFRADPAHRGQVLDRGLWRYTRHPNYFGDAVVWWGFFLIALATPGSLWTIASPIVMTYLLVKVSGVALLEQKLSKTRPGYAEYVRRTSAFFPWPPKPPSGA